MSIGVRMIPRVKLAFPLEGAEPCEHEIERGSSYVVVLECECGASVG